MDRWAGKGIPAYPAFKKVEAAKQTTRQMYVDEMLPCRLDNGDGA